MSDWQLKTPVAFLVFNRPAQTERVFEAIRQAKPPKLLVVADGARPERPGEAEKCAAVRAIIDRVDWDCEVLKNYAGVNMGCRMRVSSGLNWVFETVEEAIILEDDCLPNPSFFRFCQEMLERYREDERIMTVSGTNYLGEWKSDTQSYHFSYYGGIWGWASWRRSWKYYDVEMKSWKNQEVKDRIRDVLVDESQYKAKAKQFEDTFLKKVDTWDYQWSFTRLVQSGMAVVPCVNLVSNIGFGAEATHTRSTDSDVAEMPRFDLKFPIRFNQFTAVDREYDRNLFHKIVSPRESILAKINKKLRKVASSLK